MRSHARYELSQAPCENHRPPFPSAPCPRQSLLSSSCSKSLALSPLFLVLVPEEVTTSKSERSRLDPGLVSDCLTTENLQPPTASSGGHFGTHPLPQHHALDIPGPVHIEHYDRHAVVHAQRNRRRVHHLQVLAQHLAIGNGGKKLRVRNLLRIGVVNSVHACGFQDYVRLDFHRAQRRRGVRRKIRIPCPRRKNHHAVFFQVPHRAPPDKRLGNFFHFDGAQHAREHAFFFQRVLQRQRVDDRREHAHVVAGGAVDLKAFLPGPAENISAAHHDRRLHAQFVHIFQLTRDGL